MDFYLGTHIPSWLWSGVAPVPLFVSRNTLCRYKTLQPSKVPWALDSGGFTHIQKHGTWTLSPKDYIKEVCRYKEEIGQMQWAAPQDWMCEPIQLKRTGKTVKQHQTLTIDNFISLREIDPSLPIIPVLQGWEAKDYLSHREEYERRGILLEKEATVGLGSVCRRQATQECAQIVRSLQPLKLHGFGFKIQGLRNIAHLLKSADSLAWSMGARKLPLLLDACVGSHKNCANCPKYALIWRQQVLNAIETNKEEIGQMQWAAPQNWIQRLNREGKMMRMGNLLGGEKKNPLP